MLPSIYQLTSLRLGSKQWLQQKKKEAEKTKKAKKSFHHVPISNPVTQPDVTLFHSPEEEHQVCLYNISSNFVTPTVQYLNQLVWSSQHSRSTGAIFLIRRCHTYRNVLRGSQFCEPSIFCAQNAAYAWVLCCMRTRRLEPTDQGAHCCVVLSAFLSYTDSC